MQRSQVYLSETHLEVLAAFARVRKTTQSALIREALDEYLSRQPPVDKRALRCQAFAAWSVNPGAPTVAELRGEERGFRHVAG